jgi:hypothetical protein
MATHWGALADKLDVDFCVRVGLMILPPLLLALVALGGIYLLSRWTGFGWAFQWAALVIFFAVQTGAFALQAVPALRAQNEIHYGDLRFVQQFLSAEPQSATRPPTVYWPLWRLDYVWFDLQADSYFAAEQLVGNVFARATAMEGERRIELVSPFEIDTARRKQMLISARRQRELERLYGASFKKPPPSLDDLLRLCADERLDYVVVRQAFPGWYCDHNDDWFIYDCREIRARGNFERSREDLPQAESLRHRMCPANGVGRTLSGKETRT